MNQCHHQILHWLALLRCCTKYISLKQEQAASVRTHSKRPLIYFKIGLPRLVVVTENARGLLDGALQQNRYAIPATFVCVAPAHFGHGHVDVSIDMRIYMFWPGISSSMAMQADRGLMNKASKTEQNYKIAARAFAQGAQTWAERLVGRPPKAVALGRTCLIELFKYLASLQWTSPTICILLFDDQKENTNN